MKSLTAIQLELRKLMETIDNLSVDLENLKSKEEVPTHHLLKKIEILAKEYPIHNVALSQGEDYEKKCYIQMLSIIAQQNSESLSDKLLYIYRIVVGCQCHLNLSEVQVLGMMNSPQFFGEVSQVLAKYKNALMLDALMLIHMNGEATQEELLLVAELAGILKYEIQDLCIITQLAAALLENNIKKFEKIKPHKPFKGVKHLIPKQWITFDEIFCGEVNYGMYGLERMYRDVKVSEGAYVNKGKVLVENADGRGGKIIAPIEGKVKFVKDSKSSDFFSNVYENIYILNCRWQ